MKKSMLVLVLLACVGFWGCDEECDIGPANKIEVCVWDASEVADQNIWTEHIIEPIVSSTDCNCIVSGEVKYENVDGSAIVLYYGEGDCDEWAYKVTYDSDYKDYDKEGDKDDDDCKDWDCDKDDYEKDEHVSKCKFKPCAKRIKGSSN